MEYLFYVGILCFAVVILKETLDLLAHISRYRHHIRQYPSSRKIRGRVWKGTK